MKKINIILAAFAIVTSLNAVSFAKDKNTVKPDKLNAQFTAPKAVKMVKPQRVFYTASREVEGYVTVEITVDEKGDVESAGVIYKTSNLAVRSAISALNDWKFEPAKLNGEPVRSVVAYSMPFGQDLEIIQPKDYQPKVVIDDTKLALLRN